VVVEVDQKDGVMVVTLNRPEALNALTSEVHSQLGSALEKAGNSDVGAVVITGAGRGFCVGQDLNEATQGETDIGGHLRRSYHPNVRLLRGLDKPVIAAVNGVCAGAGLSLAVACDMRIASQQASFAPAFVNIGLVPDSGGSFFLVELLGFSRAFEWMASGRKMAAEEAEKSGLASRVVDHDNVLSAALETASNLAQMPGEAVGMTKRLFEHARRATLEEQLEMEAQLQSVAASQPAFAQKVSEFLQGRVKG
jgi:2-(1,2-epoxy-1,2-dihydrophenyl)acetyl-CoA isomerase